MSDTDWWVWVVVAVAAIAVIAMVAAAARNLSARRRIAQRKREDLRRHEAAGLRNEASIASVEVRRTEEAAQEAHVEAAEAARTAEALEQQAARERADVESMLVEAERIDPDAPSGTTAGADAPVPADHESGDRHPRARDSD